MAGKVKCKLDCSQVILIAAVTFVVFLSTAQSATVLGRFQRSVSTESTTSSTNKVSCKENNPCGWAVYVPFTRMVDYFMKNTCECPKGKECLRTDDDLSVSAYVYRCRVGSDT